MLYKKRKISHFLALLSFGCMIPLSLLGLSSEDPKPTAYFQAILWDSERSETFTYAPWGNIDDQNASLLNISVSSDTLTVRFAYYGTSPLKLYRQKKESVIKNQNKLAGNSLDIRQLELAVEYDFQIDEGSTVSANKEDILLLRRANLNKFNVYALPFSQNKVPNGSFLFQSFAKEDTFFRAGTQKFKLSAGGSRLVTPKIGELEKSLKIEGFLLKDKKYQLAMERNIGAFEKKRGIFIINVKGKSIKPYSLIERYTNYENALGYGASPSSNEPILEDNETNPSP